MSSSESEEPILLPSFTPRLWGISFLIFLIVVAGGWLVTQFASAEYVRDEKIWQEKLNLIAESRATDIGHWVESHFRQLRALADNPSLQLYLTTVQTPAVQGDAALSEDVAQKSYLRNLLIFTADRNGFSAGTPASAIPANVVPQGQGGLAVLNGKNALVVSTSMPPSLLEQIRQRATAAPAAQESLIDMYKDADGRVYAGFILPVYAVQGERNARSQIGRVVGLIAMDERFFDLLKHPGTVEKTLETVLVRRNKGQIEFLSPRQDGGEPLSLKIDANKDNSIEALLMQNPGSFIDTSLDYRAKPVLATSRAIAHTPWLMIVKVDRAEALYASAQHRFGMILIFILLIAVIILIIVAVWWQAYSKRSLLQSHYFRKMAHTARAQERLLQLVTDNQSEPIYIVDETLTLHFVNRRAADDAGMTKAGMLGKPLAEVRGPVRAKIIGDACKVALEHGLTLYDTQRVQESAFEKIIRFAFVPVPDIPIPGLVEVMPGVLVVEQDITAVVRERERRLATLRQLVRTLIRLMDRRDPFAANHSLLVAELAGQVASSMTVDPMLAETTRIAAQLMNIGKIIVPVELLTKTKPLTAQERQTIQESMKSAAQIVSRIAFDGPVAETLRQWPERWDGSGPQGLKGEEILISARIVAPCNAFIGMISPRSWRDAMPVEAAVQTLLNQAGTQFDRNVIVALIHYIENQQGKDWVRRVLENNRSGHVRAAEEDYAEGLL
jgi:PAS domain-containing protein